MSNQGHIFQINASQGGVPKTALREAVVNELGLTADSHAHPKIHGGPERALCLFSLERIVALQAEGHPIFPGSVGENITVAGLDWEQVVPGGRLLLGADVLVEVTRYTTPCATIVASFADGDSNRILEAQHAGWSRVYAKVLRTGNIRVGSTVRLGESKENKCRAAPYWSASRLRKLYGQKRLISNSILCCPKRPISIHSPTN